MIFVVVSSKASGGEPSFFGYQFKTVLSGSMEPTFMTGSVIGIDPNIDKDNLQKGDVITFMKDETNLITHRINDVVKKESGVIYQTKGDNNEAPDNEKVLAANVVGVYSGVTIPYLGYLMNFANSKMGSVILLIVPGLLLLVYSGFTIWSALSQLEVKGKDRASKV